MTATLDLTDCPTPIWLTGGHLQTIYGAYIARHHHIHFVRQRIQTPDGDFLDLDWAGPGLFADRLPTGQNAPRDFDLRKTAATRWISHADWDSLSPHLHNKALAIFHGLEGSSNSHYVQAIAQYFRARGWIVVVAHFRGCSGFSNRLARSYYSGDSEEIAFVLNTVRLQLPQTQWHTVGVSLGGNALLKYLGEQQQQAQWLRAAAAISAPTDLVSCGQHLSESRAGRWLYSPHFLKSMKNKVLEKAKHFPGLIDVWRLGQARTLRDFDDVYTAPMHGYQHALDYWTQASSKPLLKHIQVPTLVLNAQNDPFIPADSLPTVAEASEHVVLHQPKSGGHVGFTTGGFPGHLDWLPTRIAAHFSAQHL